MRSSAAIVLLTAAALAACHKAPEPPQALDGPIPAKICSETKKALDTLAGQGGVDLTDKGEATVEHNIWLAMPPEQRDSLARALAFRAGCTSGRQSKEEEVTIRGEDGMVLMHRFVSTRVDIQSVLEGGG